MSFDSILRTIVDECGDALGAVLIGIDGIPIEQVLATQLPEGWAEEALDEELLAAGVEFGRILDECRKASDSVGGGSVDEAMIRLARYCVLQRVVDEENVLLMLVVADGNVGKARFLMRRHLLALREQL